MRLENETVWLTQAQMAELFESSVPNVSIHIRNLFKEGELRQSSVLKEFLTTAADGKNYLTRFYNLDVIISVGYRVKSLRGTQFRIWATQRLREFIIKGFTLDDERLKQAGGGGHFEELLERIRDIRSSEKVFWRKVLDLYATSSDYDGNTKTSHQFLPPCKTRCIGLPMATPLRKLSTSGRSARKNQPLGLLTTRPGARTSGAKPMTAIAKNYLTEDEIAGPQPHRHSLPRIRRASSPGTQAHDHAKLDRQAR